MLLTILLVAATQPAPACHASQLRLSLDARDGDFNGMSHSGTALSLRNVGPDCTLPALPMIEFRDRKGRVLPALRRPRIGMHPGPVMVPVRLGKGQRAETDLRWVSGPVFDTNRSVRPSRLIVRIGKATLSAPLNAMLFGETGSPVTFDQTPLRAIEGMAGS